jgi:phospholipase C
MQNLVKCGAFAFVPLLLFGCSGSGSAPQAGLSGTLDAARQLPQITPATGLPKYVIVMVQENRSVDNLFQTQPGVDTQSYGPGPGGTPIKLVERPLGAPYDCDHSHAGFVKDVQQGFYTEGCGLKDASYSYVNPADIKQYTQLASTYAFADHVLQTNEGPSFPAHQYLIAATSNDVPTSYNISENDTGLQAGCGAAPSQRVTTIDMSTAFPGVEGHPIFPCINPNTIFNELDKAHVSWKYYTPNLGTIWNAPYAIESLYTNDSAKVIVPETTVLSDIANGTLANVSYVIPRAANSDHPGPNGNAGGPQWVASVVNALGTSKYWKQCAIVVVWDDWGGWFDHIAYRHPVGLPNDPYEYGFRVPLLAIGPYAKKAYVGHEPRDFTAIPHFIESVYGLAPLGNLNELDRKTDNLFGLFDFAQTPRAYQVIATPSMTIQQLRMLREDDTPVDTE